MTQQPRPVQEERQMTIDREAGYIETIKASGCEVNELTADEITSTDRSYETSS